MDQVTLVSVGQYPPYSAAQRWPRARFSNIANFIAAIFFALAIFGARPASAKLVGMYTTTPGTMSYCSGSLDWPPILSTNPYYNGGQRYPTDTAAYMNYMLDDARSMGVDFLMVDMSNGIHYGCPPLQASLLLLLDTADARMRAGVPTPHIAIWSPKPGGTNGPADDNNWIWDNVVHSGGVSRPSYMWLNGEPVWGVYSVNPFTSDYADPRFYIRYICNSGNNECHQKQVDTGVVWPWSTLGNPNSPGCPASSNGSPASCPLASTRSNEITIMMGYQNKIPCTYYWAPGTCVPADGYQVGFSLGYYNDQWSFATARNPEILLINSYDGTEGGWIQARSDYSPANAFVSDTADHVISWKGSLSLADIGPPPPPPASQPPSACGVLQPGQGLQPNQALFSCNGRFKLIMQPDGNLVLYDLGTWATPARYTYQSGTLGPDGAGGYELIMQPDGNLVLYASTGRVLGNTGTLGHAGAVFRFGNDGNMSIVQGAAVVWSANLAQPSPPPQPQAATGCGLQPNQGLLLNQSVYSCNGRFRLTMQQDGNLVLYDNVPSNHAIWQSGTLGSPAFELLMQPDGNLVIYTINNGVVWNTNTFGHAGAWLGVGDDGNLFILQASTALWMTSTWQLPCQTLASGATLASGQAMYSCTSGWELIVQPDGNLVLYNSSGQAAWSAPGTYGHSGDRLVMQGDGNLVVYDTANHPLWASWTQGNPGAYLSVQPDGNLVVRGTAGQALWHRF